MCIEGLSIILIEEEVQFSSPAWETVGPFNKTEKYETCYLIIFFFHFSLPVYSLIKISKLNNWLILYTKVEKWTAE